MTRMVMAGACLDGPAGLGRAGPAQRQQDPAPERHGTAMWGRLRCAAAVSVPGCSLAETRSCSGAWTRKQRTEPCCRRRPGGPVPCRAVPPGSPGAGSGAGVSAGGGAAGEPPAGRHGGTVGAGGVPLCAAPEAAPGEGTCHLRCRTYPRRRLVQLSTFAARVLLGLRARSPAPSRCEVRSRRAKAFPSRPPVAALHAKKL